MLLVTFFDSLPDFLREIILECLILLVILLFLFIIFAIFDFWEG